MRKKIVSIVALVIVLVTVACTVFAESLIGGGSGWRYNAGAVSITAHVHISGKSVVGTGTAVCGNENYTAAENKTINVTVNVKDAIISVNNSTLDLFVDDNLALDEINSDNISHLTVLPPNFSILVFFRQSILSSPEKVSFINSSSK